MTNANVANDSTARVEGLLGKRLAVVGALAESLESSRFALGRNDAEAIARGAAHQAELCRQWSRLEEELRAQTLQRRMLPAAATSVDSPEGERSAQLAAEWAALSARIRYLTRVHSSLLRHLQRSLAVWSRIAASCAPTYAPERDFASPCGASLRQTAESVCPRVEAGPATVGLV